MYLIDLIFLLFSELFEFMKASIFVIILLIISIFVYIINIYQLLNLYRLDNSFKKFKRESFKVFGDFNIIPKDEVELIGKFFILKLFCIINFFSPILNYCYIYLIYTNMKIKERLDKIPFKLKNN